MTFGEAEIQQLVANIWQLMLGWPIEAKLEAADARTGDQFLTACVSIAGEWEGTIVVDCGLPLASDAAVKMFQTSTTTAEDCRDALGELSNMIAGNLKALLPEPCYLGLPAVSNGRDYAVHVLDSRLAARTCFECRGQRLVVSVLQRQRSRVIA
jgi:chemotaxis protein CheX